MAGLLFTNIRRSLDWSQSPFVYADFQVRLTFDMHDHTRSDVSRGITEIENMYEFRTTEKNQLCVGSSWKGYITESRIDDIHGSLSVCPEFTYLFREQ